MRSPCTRAVVAASALALAVTGVPAAAAEPSAVSVSLGAEYTTGDYDTGRDTSIWYFPLTLRYDADGTALWLTLPYIAVEGPGNVVAGRGGMPIVRTRQAAASRTESGLGDLELGGSVRLIAESASTPRLDLTGKIKLGTADETDNLGTGENDYAVQLDLTRTRGPNTLYGSLGYEVFGDPPGIDLKNAFYGLAGLTHALDRTNDVGVELFAQEKTVAGAPGQLELSVLFGHRIERGSKLTFYGLVGLQDGSPDWGAGITLTLSP